MLAYLKTFGGTMRDRTLRLLGTLMSTNDPQWGRRPNQGPPDLDEILREFNRKLNNLFGRRGGGGDEPPGGGDVKRFGGGAGLLLGLIVVVWLASSNSITVLRPNSPVNTLVTSFGDTARFVAASSRP